MPLPFTQWVVCWHLRLGTHVWHASGFYIYFGHAPSTCTSLRPLLLPAVQKLGKGLFHIYTRPLRCTIMIILLCIISSYEPTLIVEGPGRITGCNLSVHPFRVSWHKASDPTSVQNASGTLQSLNIKIHTSIENLTKQISSEQLKQMRCSIQVENMARTLLIMYGCDNTFKFLNDVFAGSVLCFMMNSNSG